MFLELKENHFKEAYFDMLKSNLSAASMDFEGDNKEANLFTALKILEQYEAINYSFSCDTSSFSHYDFLEYLCEIGKRISGSSVTTYRKIPVHVIGSNVKRTNPSLIINDLIYLIDDYQYQINEYKKYVDQCMKCNVQYDDKKLFEIEASFHIRFLYIHPFEDYNGRIARIMLTRNLCELDQAPAIIDKKEKDEYCSYIEKNDVPGLGKFLYKLSHQELEKMINLYAELNNAGLIEGSRMNEEQNKKYRVLKKN